MSLVSIAARLQPRDLALARLLDQHQALTTTQITAVLFDSPVTAANRLRLLRRIGFIDRFSHRHAGGEAVTCWIPGPLSARYAALADDRTPPTAKALRDTQDRTVASPQLEHLLGVNQFFSDLLAGARRHPGARLLRWWSARRASTAHAGRIHPDGHGIWAAGDRPPVGFWLENDQSTEDHGRLIGKLGAYRRLHNDGGPDYPVLFWLATRRRETNLHQRLAANGPTGVLVATAARDSLNEHGPAGRIWRLAGNGRHRLALADVPGQLAEPGPLCPALTPQDSPLHGLIATDRGERLER
jgi:hypothetical protein